MMRARDILRCDSMHNCLFYFNCSIHKLAINFSLHKNAISMNEHCSKTTPTIAKFNAINVNAIISMLFLCVFFSLEKRVNIIWHTNRVISFKKVHFIEDHEFIGTFMLISASSSLTCVVENSNMLWNFQCNIFFIEYTMQFMLAG